MLDNNVNKDLKGKADWLLSSGEVDEIGLDVNYDDFEPEITEFVETELDIATYAISGNVAAVIGLSQIYIAMAKKNACQAKGGGYNPRIDKNCKKVKEVIVSAVNLTLGNPDKVPSDILLLAIKQCNGDADELIQYKRVAGSQFIKDVVALSDLTIIQQHKLVIHSNLTAIGLIGQVKKVCGYLPVRLKKSCASKSKESNKRERHLEILSCKGRGMTQVQVANAIDVSVRTIKRFWNKPCLILS
ncbi:LNG1/LNG2 family protein [Shewanella sp. SW36]|uniref:LNG1/LNG2 family protein n=1 Tax=unclassified Shewanella TaxID=196818 RepID=UPI0021DA5F63|nr:MULTISPECIES: LNG1/LNG2 family protein [unclassified Shewanella]MCU7976268.1 LNG1/LNG2 family protein [Shewanella sp. SW36]MCU7991508.1 LNG1/LNG2 family protein [Shewanella sp. SW1]MCU8052328.1 LNG1/LNG2 family protein [Shewanella sp. SM43]